MTYIMECAIKTPQQSSERVANHNRQFKQAQFNLPYSDGLLAAGRTASMVGMVAKNPALSGSTVNSQTFEY